MVFEAILSRVLEFVGARGLPITVIVVGTAFLLYARKALGVGALLADWTSKAMVAVAFVLVLLVAGVIPTIDLARAGELVWMAYEAIRGVAW